METESRLLKAARSHHRAGRWAAAESVYRRIIEDEPDLKAVALHALGVMASAQGRPHVAVDQIWQAVQLDGSKAVYYVDVAQALEKVGQLAEAIAAMECALALGDSSLASLARMFSLYLAFDRPDDALALARRLDSDPGLQPIFESDPEQGAVRGRIRRITGDHAGARTDLTKALAANPGLASTWQELGRIERCAGNDAEAVACYDRALAVSGNDLDVVSDKGIALQRLGRIEEARSCFREATLERPYALCRGADIDLAALADVDISPERARTVHRRGLEAERLGRHAEAMALFALASSLNPRDDRARKDLDRVAAQFGKGRVRFYFLFHSSMGILAQDPDLYLRRLQLGQVPEDVLIIFLSGTRPANRTLLTMWGRHMPLLVDDRLYYSMLEVLLPGLRVPKEWLWTREYENHAHPKSHGVLAFTPDENERGRAGLRALGVDPDADWFVCIFARDEGWSKKTFSGLTDTHTYFRNADINSYHAAIKSIVDRGGTVIRIGASMMQPLTLNYPKVIDYAMTARDDFMDIYLVAHSRFVMGTPAGITDVAKPFDVPCLFVNEVAIGFCPYGKQVLYVPKRLVYAATGEPVPIAEYLALYQREREDAFALVYTDSGLKSLGHAYVDNTPEELREAAEEMMDRLDGRWGENPEDRALLDRYFALFSSLWFHLVTAPAQIRQPVALSHLRRHRDWYFPEG